MSLADIGDLTLGQYMNFIKQAAVIIELLSGESEGTKSASPITYGKKPSKMDWDKVRKAAAAARSKGIA